MLLSYAADKIRTNDGCGGCILWCLTDGFGEVGFSLLDHNGDPKPVYHYLRRAYAPVRLVLWREGEEAVLYASNDTAEERTLNLSCGYVGFDGTYGRLERISVTLPAFTKIAPVGRYRIGDEDLSHGAIYARADDGDVLPVTLRTADFRELCLPRAATLSVTDVTREGDALSFSVSTDVFAHAVHFNLGAEVKLSDEYFDLLPGEARRVTLRGADAVTAADIRPVCVYLD